MKRILIVRMGSLGDIIHTLPAAATLKRAFPEAEIDWIVEKHWSPLLERNPQISRLQIVETRRWRRSLSEAGTWRSLIESIGRLRDRGYDCALDFQGLIKSAVVARLSGAERVLGFERRELREPAAGVFYTSCAAPPANGAHVIERNLALAAAAGARHPVLEFCFGPVLATRGDMPGFVLVGPSAGWRAKQWPEENYAELIVRIARDLGRPVGVNCGPGEEELGQRIVDLAAAAKPRLLRPSVAELIALVSQASLMIGGDTGPVHLAAARGTPVVAIFGPTDPARNGPVGAPARVLRTPEAATTYARRAERDAIRQVTVEQVFDAAAELLAAAP